MTEFSVYHGDQKGLQPPSNHRYDQFLSVWKSIISRVETQLRFLTSSVFTEVFNFIENSHTSWLSLHNLEAKSIVNLEQIPTALLLAGVNTPDHSVIYGHLRNLILESGGHVAVVSPGANTTSVRSLVALVVQQLLDDSCHQSKGFRNDEGSDENLRVPSQDLKESKYTLVQNFTPATRSSYLALIEWYYSGTKKYCGPSAPEWNPEFKTPAPPTTPRPRSQRSTSQPRSQKSHQPCPMSSASPRLSTPTRRNQRFSLRSNEVSNTLKSELADSVSASPGSGVLSDLKQSSASLRPLVIILTEIESIPVQVLCDFIELTSLYVSGQIRGRSCSLPINFVFGLSTIPEIGFEPRFSASILSRLTIRRFSVPSPSAFLNVVLKEFCMLEHYLKTPHPELLELPELAHKYLTSINSRDLAQIVTLDYPSLANCVLDNTTSTLTVSHPTLPIIDNSSPQTAQQTTHTSSSSSSVNSRLVNKIVEHLENHLKLQYLIPYVLNWLLIIMTPVSARPLGKNIGDLYRLWLKNGLVNAEEFNLTINLLGGVPKEHLLNSVQDAYDFLLKESASLIQSQHPTSLWWSPSTLSEGRKCLNSLADSTLSWYTKLSMACQEASMNKQLSQCHQEQSTDNDTLTTTAEISVNNQDTVPAKPVEFNTKRKISLRNLRQSCRSPTDLSRMIEFQGTTVSANILRLSYHDKQARLKPPLHRFTLTKARAKGRIEAGVVKKAYINKGDHRKKYATSSPNRPLSAITSTIHKTQWDITRKEFLSWIQLKLNELIPSFHQLPLHEVFYGPSMIENGIHSSSSSSSFTYDDSSIHSQLALSIRRRLNPPFQRCLHQALVNPGVYLQITDLKLSNSSSISSKLFDLCILYKLLIETNKMVNLYDWLMAFASILGEAVDSENPPSQETQCRFLQGLAELQYLGCIKSTRRKVDHVIRLTWISGLL
ncbi:putative origin recognition complex subunit [Schistosoma mansoni]|uniref:putative origin recognition complex subunit n=1 Tax=Schistosoma mansoni TaxID=6183 RepID=UPI0001A63567|nr:putative origin recognition complex subunit [Schistosoma mansoni]|eukprot:XP_018653429.1 putative origin recognition complex subunit [Schistosoma mansoni]